MRKRTVEVDIEAIISGDFGASELRRLRKSVGKKSGKKSVGKKSQIEELQIDTLELPSDQKKSLRRRRKSFMAEEYLHMTISKLLSGSITILFGFGMSPKRTTNVYVLLYASMEDNSITLIEINNAVAMGNSIEQRSPDYSFQIDITSWTTCMVLRGHKSKCSGIVDLQYK